MAAATMTLTDFLLARISEDGDDACAMAGLNPDGSDDWAADTDGYAVSERMIRVAKRVLAECEAKRQIVERLTNLADGRPVDSYNGAAEARWCALRTLAAVYADHPDYREEWRA